MIRADERPFLDAVLARPDADAPRLVYADFLEQSGTPADAARGELLRVQLAAAHAADPTTVAVLKNRERELHERHYESWTAALRGFVSGVVFRRGIPDVVSIPAAEFIDRGDELFELLPVRHVHLTNAAECLLRLVHCPHLGRVRELNLSCNDLGNGGVHVLVRSAHLKHVGALDLGFNGLDDDGVKALAAASGLPALRELALNDNGQVTSEGVRAVAESPFLGGLRSLDLSGNDVNDLGVRALAASRCLPALESVKLAGNHIGDAGVVALAASPLLARCLKHDTRLDLRKNTIGPAGALALAGSDAMIAATALDLTDNYLGDRGFAGLVASRHFGRLRVLRLAQNQITTAGVRSGAAALARLCRQLRTLDLSGNRLTAAGIAAVADAKGESPLAVDVSGNVHPVPPLLLLEVMNELDALKRRVNHPSDRHGV
jgi:uncharacterized protein (TIGR02996 family)